MEFLTEKWGGTMDEKNYKAIFKSHLIACTIIDKNGFVKKITKAMLERFSISIQRVKEESLLHILDCEALTEFVLGHMKESEEKESLQGASALVAIKGSKERYLWNQVELTPISTDEEITYLMIFHDCTESYQAQMILESNLTLSGEVFLFFDNNNCLLQCSEEAVRIFGFPNRLEAMGMYYTTFFRNHLSLSVLDEVFQTLKDGRSIVQEVAVKYKGVYEKYELQAFNVMVKQLKSGMAICLHKVNVDAPYMLEEPKQSYESRIEPYLLEMASKNCHAWEEKEYVEVLSILRKSMEVFDYIRACEVVTYLLTVAPENERLLLGEVKKEVMRFQYEQAAALFDGYYNL